jgi:hypothetical protein
VNDYLYAILERLPPAWRASTGGVNGAPVTARKLGDLVVVCSRMADVPAGNPRTLARHHDVVAATMDAEAVLPFRYGVAVPAVDLEPWVSERRAVIDASLGLVRGCIEMNVKLLRLDCAVDRQVAVRGARAAGADAGGPGDQELRELGDHLVDRAGLPDWRYRPAGRGGNVVASVAFLVPRADLSDFLARIAPVASHAAGVAVVPTGPWPAYSFVPSFDRLPLSRISEAHDARDARASERRAG